MAKLITIGTLVTFGTLIFAGALGVTASGQSSNEQMWSAISSGDKAKVEALIASGADVNSKTASNGQTALSYASLFGKKEIVELLIEKGADVNTSNIYGESPLFQAAATDIAELLIAKGANVNAKNRIGETPLMKACENLNKDMAALLLDKGADVNARTGSGSTALYYAESGPIGKAVESERLIAVAELLVVRGADVNGSGETPLDIAASHGEATVAEMLIAHGAKVNAASENGETALDVAARNGKTNVAALLIAKGADVNAKNSFGQAPLNMSACNLAMVELLTANGADINNRDGPHGTPLEEAVACGNTGVVGLLIAKGVGVKDDNLEAANRIEDAQIRQEMTAILHAAMEKQSGDDLPTLLARFKGHSENEALRSTIIDLVLKQHAATPPEAEAAAGRGTYIFKNAASPDDVLSAAKEYLAAIEAAPWVPNYYYNLCIVLEKTPYTQQALHACKLYLVAAPDATDAGAVRQRIAGLQYATDRDKAQMKQRTLYIKGVNRDVLYHLGGISGMVSGRDIALKLFVDWSAAPPKYQVYAGCTYGNDGNGEVHDLVTTDSWIQLCNPAVQLHLIIKPEGEGFVEVVT